MSNINIWRPFQAIYSILTVKNSGPTLEHYLEGRISMTRNLNMYLSTDPKSIPTSQNLQFFVTANGTNFICSCSTNYNCHAFEVKVKGNPIFQGISNWIPQILHYHSSKHHKNIENLQLTEQDILFTVTCFLHLSQRKMFFSSWTQYSKKF